MENEEQKTMKPILLLSGPPGAGKSTVACELIAILPGPVACIEGDKFWSFFAKGYELSEKGRNLTTIMVSMTAASLAYVRAGYHVIIDFSVPPWFLPTAFKIVNERNIGLDYVMIRPSEKVCAARAAARAEGAIADYTVYKDFYASFTKAERHAICDDESDAATIAANIRDGIYEEIFRVTN
jgi:predicted kinase